jgi:hypothetical protein
MWNPLKSLYDWFYETRSRDEQMEIHRADLILLEHYRKILNRDRKIIYINRSEKISRS